MLAAQPKRAQPWVLVVDDSAEMRRYLRVLLELDRFHVETANNGIEALQRLGKGSRPAAVLLDVEMPGLDGLKTLRLMRKFAPGLKVILCSGADSPAYRQEAAALGAYAFLAKPVQQLYLSAVLERCREASLAPASNVVTLPEPAAGRAQ